MKVRVQVDTEIVICPDDYKLNKDENVGDLELIRRIEENIQECPFDFISPSDIRIKF